MSDLIGKIVNLSFERLLPVGHSSQKQSRERSGTQSPLCRDLGMGEVSIRKLTEIMGMTMSYTVCGVRRKQDAEDHHHVRYW